MTTAEHTILVVEDDPMVLMGLQMILESWGMRVLAAEDLPSVLAALADGAPDLILSDLHLRGTLTGFEVVDRVRAEAGRAVPAVILTGETGRRELAEGHARGLAFLHKPVQAGPLRQAITDALAA